MLNWRIRCYTKSRVEVGSGRAAPHVNMKCSLLFAIKIFKFISKGVDLKVIKLGVITLKEKPFAHFCLPLLVSSSYKEWTM